MLSVCLIEFVSRNKNIITINLLLELNDYQNPQLEQVIAASDNCSQIYLNDQKLIDEDMKIVVKQAMINKQCLKLNLSTNPITPKGALILASGLKNNSMLQRLHLDFTRIGDLGVQYLAKALSNNNNVLKVLTLSVNMIKDDGAEHLAVMLKTNRTLTHLFLSSNEISDDGVAMLANALQNHNNTLEYLDLSGNKQMTELSVDFLIEMVKHTRSLKMLSVWSCNLSKENEGRLRKVAQANKNIRTSVNNSWTSLKNILHRM
jgi:NLR family CARD domain-containing protein 3